VAVSTSTSLLVGRIWVSDCDRVRDDVTSRRTPNFGSVDNFMTARTPASPPENEDQERIRLERRLARDFAKAVTDFSLIEPDDRIMVALSGGKDSHAMLYLLRRFQRASPTKFELIAVHLDQKQPGHDTAPLVQYLQREGYPFEVARPEAIFDFFRSRGFRLERLLTNGGYGCNQFVFLKKRPATPPKASGDQG